MGLEKIDDIDDALRYIEERRRERGIDVARQEPSTLADVARKIVPPEKTLPPIHASGRTKAELLKALDELTPQKIPFAAIPKAIMFSTEYQTLSRGESRVLGILYAYRSHKRKVSRPTVRILVEKLYGIPRAEYDRHRPEVSTAYRQVMRWMDALKEKGLVFQLNRACRGTAAEYYLPVCLAHIEWIKEHNGCSPHTTQSND